MTVRGIVRRLAANRRATVAVEFALILPVMALLAGGIYTIGSLAYTYTAVNRLAMQYATTFADCSDNGLTPSPCSAELTAFCSTISLGNIIPQLQVANLTLTMAQVQMSSATTPLPTVEYAAQYKNSACQNSITLTSAQTTALQAGNGLFKGQTVILVTVSYTYQVLLFQAIMTPFVGSSSTISATVVQLK